MKINMNPFQLSSSRSKSSIDITRLKTIVSNGVMQSSVTNSYRTKRIKFSFPCVISYSFKWYFALFRAKFPTHAGIANTAKKIICTGDLLSEKSHVPFCFPSNFYAVKPLKTIPDLFFFPLPSKKTSPIFFFFPLPPLFPPPKRGIIEGRVMDVSQKQQIRMHSFALPVNVHGVSCPSCLFRFSSPHTANQ